MLSSLPNIRQENVFGTLALLPVFCPLVGEQKKRLSLRPMNTNGLGGGFIHEFMIAQRRRDYIAAGEIRKGFCLPFSDGRPKGAITGGHYYGPKRNL
jgi:hypothetical protein